MIRRDCRGHGTCQDLRVFDLSGNHVGLQQRIHEEFPGLKCDADSRDLDNVWTCMDWTPTVCSLNVVSTWFIGRRFSCFSCCFVFSSFSLVSVLSMIFQTVIWNTSGISIPFRATCNGPQGDIGCWTLEPPLPWCLMRLTSVFGSWADEFSQAKHSEFLRCKRIISGCCR